MQEAPTSSKTRPETSVTASVIVPIWNEQENVISLLERIHGVATRFGKLEVVFVDDSDHDMGAIAANKACEMLCDGDCPHLTIRHIHRTGESRHGGLSGAVIDGTQAAQSAIVVVMDGDLQHPPEDISELLYKLGSGYDIAIASRYAEGGSSKGLDGLFRHIVSRGSTIIAKLLFPHALRHVSDPMTGFFAVRRDLLDLDKLRPRGFKILVEILLHHKHLRRSEVPFRFGKRKAGESKGDMKQGLEFFQQLLQHRLRNPIASFLVGGGAIAVLGSLILSGFVRLDVPETMAYVIQFAVTVWLNFKFNWKFTWPSEVRERIKSKAIWFTATRAVTFIGGLVIFRYLIENDMHHQVAYVLVLAPITIFNYLTTRRIMRPVLVTT